MYCTVKESFSEEVAFEERPSNDLCKNLNEEYSRQRKQQIPKFANCALEHRRDVHSLSKYLFSKYLLSTVTPKCDLTHVLNVIGFMFQKIILAGTEQTLVGLALKEKDKLGFVITVQEKDAWLGLGSEQRKVFRYWII